MAQFHSLLRRLSGLHCVTFQIGSALQWPLLVLTNLVQVSTAFPENAFTVDFAFIEIFLDAIFVLYLGQQGLPTYFSIHKPVLGKCGLISTSALKL